MKTQVIRRCLLVCAALCLCGGKRRVKDDGATWIEVDRFTHVQKDFRGIGFEVWPDVGGMSTRAFDDVLIKRWREINPNHALVHHTWSWNWDRVVPLLKAMSRHSEIWLTTVASREEPEALPDPARIAEMLERLVNKENVTNITTYCVIAGDRTVTSAAAETFSKSLGDRLKAAQLDIRVVASVPESVLSSLGDESKGGEAAAARLPMELAERMIDAVNRGEPVITCMPFADMPPESGVPEPDREGLFGCGRDEQRARPVYYGMGLFSKYIRGPAQVYEMKSPLPELKLALLRHHDKSCMLVALNKGKEPLLIQLRELGTGAHDRDMKGSLRIHLYRPDEVPEHPSADLPACEEPARITNSKKGNGFRFSVPAGTLLTARAMSDEEPPERIRSIDVSKAEDGGNLLKWQPVVDKDLCYYRVYRMNMPDFRFAKKEQIGSTIGTQFLDGDPPSGKKSYYAVLAVDLSNNTVR